MSSSTFKTRGKINGKNGKKEKPKRIRYKTDKTYAVIFDKMEAGNLKVDTVEGRIYVRYHDRWIEPYVHERKGYYFVNVYHKRKRKSVGIGRLVWMVENGQEYVPDGYDVSHEDDDPSNNCNWNLDLEPKHINRRNSSTYNSSDEDF